MRIYTGAFGVQKQNKCNNQTDVGVGASPYFQLVTENGTVYKKHRRLFGTQEGIRSKKTQ
jgi:hypothetical protein